MKKFLLMVLLGTGLYAQANNTEARRISNSFNEIEEIAKNHINAAMDLNLEAYKNSLAPFVRQRSDVEEYMYIWNISFKEILGGQMEFYFAFTEISIPDTEPHPPGYTIEKLFRATLIDSETIPLGASITLAKTRGNWWVIGAELN